MNDPHDNTADDRAMLTRLTPENQWYAIDSRPVRNGVPGGDYEVTDAWNVRLHNDALPHALVDADYFVEALPTTEDGVHAGPVVTEYAVTGMVRLTICDDREDPGRTETWADIQYDNDADPLAYSAIENADSAAKFQAERWVQMADKFMQWDGKPF